LARVHTDDRHIKLAPGAVETVADDPMTETPTQAPTAPDPYKGAQHDLIVQGSGFLSMLGGVATLALLPFFPPTAQLGGVAWLLVAPLSLVSIAIGYARITLRQRPSMAAIHASAFTGVVQIALLQWFAGGGRAPYTQLLMLPVVGAGLGQPIRRCVKVSLSATLAALSPLLYSTIDVPTTLTEFLLLTVMSVLIANVLASTRTHRARLQDAGEQANELAHLDALTGIPNRRSFDESLQAAFAQAELDGTPIALLLCDVDSFKQINDTFGHAAGDEVLCALARTLAGTVRGAHEAFRWAGDEFAVILRDTDQATAAGVAARVHDAVARECARPDGSPLSIGVGVAELRPGMSLEEVLVAADSALLEWKAEHHDRGPTPRLQLRRGEGAADAGARAQAPATP
jgi:diguanylate cyclase (GGDEF)-like protein